MDYASWDKWNACNKFNYGGVVQIVGFVVMVLLWIPFILYSQKQYEEEKRKNKNEAKEKE